MDLSSNNSEKSLSHRVNNPDGSITMLSKKRKRKIVVARGKGEHTIGAVLISPLLPFQTTMRKQLKNRGYNTRTMPFKSLVPLYYNEFVSNLQNKKSYLLPINTFEFRNNPAFQIRPSDNYNGELTTIHSDILNGISGIVDDTINLFTNAKEKFIAVRQDHFQVSETLTEEEITQAQAANKVERELESKMIGETYIKQSNIKSIIIWVASIWLIWQLVK